MTLQTIQDRVSAIFYNHGLFCASHPIIIIILDIIIGLILSSPLLTLPLPGNAPQEFRTPIEGYVTPEPVTRKAAEQLVADDPSKPRWYFGEPVGYVQQFVIKSVVSPWEPERLIHTDAFRAPLAQVFTFLDYINNFQHQDGSDAKTVSDYCLRVAESTHMKGLEDVLPQYSCLLVSPANFWKEDKTRFDGDPHILNTIYKKYGEGIRGSSSIKDILFGITRKDTGVPKYYIRNRQRQISYAITLVLKQYNSGFITALQDKLLKLYPRHSDTNVTVISDITHIHFRDHNYFVEYTPLIVAYVVLFLYLYFSVRKIEMVKSKWGLALSAVVMVFASLLMSIGTCTFFGMTPSLNGGEIFPYLVVIIGLENVLVITKSVVSTPFHLDVKLRVAQGLSKEGWYIFKNLVMELLILFVGFFTFVPAIQEFCLFAVVGLLSDFFLQMFFFTTVLSIDIRRMELSDLHKQSVKQAMETSDTDLNRPLTPSPTTPTLCPILSRISPPSPSSPQPPIQRSHSTPRLSLNTASLTNPSPPQSPTPGHNDEEFFSKLPRRLKFLNFWARTRMVQRAIMVCTVVWIVLIVYKAGLVEHIAQSVMNKNANNNSIHSDEPTPAVTYWDKLVLRLSGNHVVESEQNNPVVYNGIDEKKWIKKWLSDLDPEPWKSLSNSHWPTLFNYYNVSLRGRYLSILPSLTLSVTVSPDAAVSMRHPDESKTFAKRQSVALDRETQGHSLSSLGERIAAHRPMFTRGKLYPQSRNEFFITVALGIISCILIIYFMSYLYRCMCSRNYAKWRSSWSKVKRLRKQKQSLYYKQIRDALPLTLKGHSQEVECVVVDGPLVVSSCLGGEIRVWDSNSGDCLTAIQRYSANPDDVRDPTDGRNINDSEADLYAEFHEIRSVENKNENTHLEPRLPVPGQRSPRMPSNHNRNRPELNSQFPDLTSTIKTDFSAMSAEDTVTSTSATSGDRRFNFSNFDGLYTEHQRLLSEEEEYLRKRREESGLTQGQQGSTAEGGDVVLHQTSQLSEDGSSLNGQEMSALSDSSVLENCAPVIWCLACQDNLVIAGCGNGRIEFWDALTGNLKCLYGEGHVGVTGLCFVTNRVIAARLDGTLDFLELETFTRTALPIAVPPTPTTRLHNRTFGHVRKASLGRKFTTEVKCWDDIIHVSLVHSLRAHQRPINALLSEGGRIVTASQDYTLKVFRHEDWLCLYTLHGHNGSVTALHLDKGAPLAAVSGSDDGTVRLWDLMTGSCVHKLQGHSGAIQCLVATPAFVISCSVDDRLCIWERGKGILLHSISLDVGSCNAIAMLTSRLLVTGGQGCIYLWDTYKGEMLKVVQLGDDPSLFVRQIYVVSNSVVVCDYSSQLRVVHFPSVLEKME